MSENINEKETFKIKYIPTGNVFEDFTKEQCDELMKDEPNNFIVLDENYEIPSGDEIQTSSVLSQIADNDLTPEEAEAKAKADAEAKAKEEAEAKAKELNKMTVPQLLAHCEEKKYDVTDKMKKPEIVAFIIEKEAIQ